MLSSIVNQHGSIKSSIAHHLPNNLSLLMILFYATVNSKSIKSPPPPCTSFDCGNGLIVGYPFWRENQQQTTFCGYAGLAVTCTNGQPRLEISNNHYYILKNYSSPHNTVTIVSDEVIDSTCPILTHDVTSESNSLMMNYTAEGNKIVHLYYNCTVYPPLATNIKCLQRGAKHSYAFVHGYEPDQFNRDQHCENVTTLPVIDEAVDGIVGNGSMDGLRQGFKLRWKTNDSLCLSCEVSGGYCGYSSAGKGFFCICGGGNYSHNCPGVGDDVSAKPKPNHAAIGLLALGGLSATCFIVFFVVSKRKTKAQKRGFTKILSSQGN